jgi:hypothetical protein
VKDFTYWRCCGDFHDHEEVKALGQMVEAAKDVTYRTMLSRCREMLTWARRQGYDLDRRRGLTLSNDPTVSYHKSKFNGQPCYFLRWSAIEFIWVKEIPTCRSTTPGSGVDRPPSRFSPP